MINDCGKELYRGRECPGLDEGGRWPLISRLPPAPCDFGPSSSVAGFGPLVPGWSGFRPISRFSADPEKRAALRGPMLADLGMVKGKGIGDLGIDPRRQRRARRRGFLQTGGACFMVLRTPEFEHSGKVGASMHALSRAHRLGRNAIKHILRRDCPIFMKGTRGKGGGAPPGESGRLSGTGPAKGGR